MGSVARSLTVFKGSLLQELPSKDYCIMKLPQLGPPVLISSYFKFCRSISVPYSCFCLAVNNDTLIKNKIKFSSYIRQFRVQQLQSHKWLTAFSYILGNICAFPQILGSPSSYMTLQLLYSEFSYIWGKFDFLFYQCSAEMWLPWPFHVKKRNHKFCVVGLPSKDYCIIILSQIGPGSNLVALV